MEDKFGFDEVTSSADKGLESLDGSLLTGERLQDIGDSATARMSMERSGMRMGTASDSVKISLKYIAKIQGGYAFKSDKFTNEGIPVIRISNIYDNKVTIDSDICYEDSFWDEHPEFRVEKGDILIAMSGATVGKVGRYCDELKALLNQRVCKIIGDSKLVDEGYLYYYCLSPVFADEILKNAFGCAQPNISGKQIEEFEIRLSSLENQKRVVQQLNSISDIIVKRKQQLEELDTLIKARFVEMFGDPDTNPFEYEQSTIEAVCSSIVRGPFGSALKKEFFVPQSNNTYKVYEQKHAIQKSATIGTYYITAEKYEELKRFECIAGDIIMSCSGTMGELYQLPIGCERGVINQALCKFTLNDKILPIVFLTYMQQTIGNLETKGSGIQNIAAVSYVKAMPINLPPMNIQNDFADFVTQVDKLKVVLLKTFELLNLLDIKMCFIG